SENVGSGSVISVDPDSAFIKFDNISKGVSTGDKITRIIDPPAPLGITKDGEVRYGDKKQSNGNQGLVTLLILVVILGFLLGQGRGGSTDLIQDVRAEAVTQANEIPGVRVSWTRDPFLRGNPNSGGPYQWQVFRDSISVGPVAVADGVASSVIDDTAQTNFEASYLDPDDTQN